MLFKFDKTKLFSLNFNELNLDYEIVFVFCHRLEGFKRFYICENLLNLWQTFKKTIKRSSEFPLLKISKQHLP